MVTWTQSDHTHAPRAERTVSTNPLVRQYHNVTNIKVSTNTLERLECVSWRTAGRYHPNFHSPFSTSTLNTLSTFCLAIGWHLFLFYSKLVVMGGSFFPLSRMEIAVYGCIGPSSSLVLCVLILFLPLFGSWCIGVYLLKFKRVFIGCIWCMMVCRRSQVIYVCMYYF
jgi:hypothetical protein